MLNITDLNVSYGAIHALKGVSFTLEKGEIIALIGANGAGKSTTLNSISGILRPDSGRIVLEGNNLSAVSPAKIVQSGVVQVPEGRKIFSRMTVRENLEMGAYSLKDKAQFQDNLARVFEIFPRLQERQRQMGGLSLAVNNKCWQWEGGSWQTPDYCCWMNHPWD